MATLRRLIFSGSGQRQAGNSNSGVPDLRGDDGARGVVVPERKGIGFLGCPGERSGRVSGREAAGPGPSARRAVGAAGRGPLTPTLGGL